MFVGHYAVGFCLKKKFQEVPLWLLFIAVQLVDIFAFVFVLSGIERVRYNASDNPFLRTIIEYVPYSHALLNNLILAFFVFLVFWKLKNKLWGTILGVAVLSHWFMDVIVHVPDLPLLFNRLKVGMGLWQYPWSAFIFEISVLMLASLYFLKSAVKIVRALVLIVLLASGLIFMFFAPIIEVSSSQTSLVSLSLYGLFVVLAYWSERKLIYQ